MSTKRMVTLCALVSALSLVSGCNRAQTQIAERADIELRWEEREKVASGDAYQGPWRMNQSRFLYVDDPTVAIDDSGIVVVAWVDQARKDVVLQVYEPGGNQRFTGPVNVSRSPEIFSWLPRIVISGEAAQDIFVLWQEIVFSGGSHGGEIFFARSSDGGRTFGPPLNLSNTIAGAGKGRLTRRYWHNGSLDLAAGGDGTLYAAWTEYEGGLWFSRSRNSGGSFSQPLRVAGSDAAPARGPSLAVGANSIIHLAWTVGEDTAADIHVASSRDGGLSFGEPRRVLAGSGHADAPKIAVDQRGTVHLAYAESGGGPREGFRVLYARSTDGARSFETPREVSAGHAPEVEATHFPALRLDAEGRVYLLWELFFGRGARPHGLGLSVSPDGGETFTLPAVVPGSVDPMLGANGSRQGLLMSKLDVNAAGEIMVVNSTFKANQASHVWLFRGGFR